MNKTIQELDLKYNKIGHEGVIITIADALKLYAKIFTKQIKKFCWFVFT